MNITAIYGATPNMTFGSDILSRIILDTLLELGIYVDEVKLIDKNIPYLNSTSPNMNVANIMNGIANSDGVIFVCTTNFFSPCSVMQNFLDYFSLPVYKNILKNKNCFLLTVSNTTGEKSSLNYLSNIIQELGGFDAIKIGLNEEVAKLITSNHEYKQNFEKYVEDFYRYVNQNRKFFVPTDVPTIINSISPSNRIDSSMLEHDNNYNIKPTIDNIDAPKGQSLNGMPKQRANYNPSNNANIIGNVQPKQREASINPNVNAQRQMGALGTPQQSMHQPQKAVNQNVLNKTYGSPNQRPSMTSNEDEIFLQNILNSSDDEFNSVKNEISQSAKAINAIYDAENKNTVQSQPQPQNLNNDINQSQEKGNDIKEIAKYFQGKYSPTLSNQEENTQQKNPVINEPLTPKPKEEITPSDKTVSQMTQNLVHYYQPQLGNGLVAEIQLSITGSEQFDGFIRVNNNQCDYFNGWSNNPDVTIVSTDAIWKNILEGQLSSQRAFMTGQLKVRGNFILLSKFDQLFKLQ